jgi:hypothetical protein
VLALLGVAQLMVVLDVTIVNVALPSAQRALGFSTDSRQWVVTAYALAFGSLLLLGGKLGDLFGRKWTFVAGLMGFAGASALGGLAQSFGMLRHCLVAQESPAEFFSGSVCYRLGRHRLADTPLPGPRLMEVRVARASLQRLPSPAEQLVTASKQRRFQPVARRVRRFAIWHYICCSRKGPLGHLP